MAHIHGKAGESALQKSLEKHEKVIWIALLVLAYGGMGLGVLVGTMVNKSLDVCYLAFVVIVVIFISAVVWMRRHKSFLDEKLHEARVWHRGYEGEQVVGNLLESQLSDKFHVFNDVRFPGRIANIDHIVVGPSGIFVLNTKNWRGSVAWAEDGTTLLWNGEPDKKNTIKAAIADALDVHDKLKALTSRDFFVKPILVFPLAKVTPRLNTPVELQQDDYLIDKRLNYIDKRTLLSETDIKTVVDALMALFRGVL